MTIKTKFRPVPLRWHFCYKAPRGTLLCDLLESSGKKLNPRLEERSILLEEARCGGERGGR